MIADMLVMVGRRTDVTILPWVFAGTACFPMTTGTTSGAFTTSSLYALPHTSATSALPGHRVDTVFLCFVVYPK